MAAHLWQRVKEKVDKVAEAVALMERGEFDFPDGRKHFCEEGGKQAPRVIKSAALIYGGYSPKANAVRMRIWGPDGQWHEYYTERLGWHRQRLEGGYRQALAELTDGGSALQHLSKLAYEALVFKLADTEKAAKSFSVKDLTALYVNTTKLEASIKGDTQTRREQPRLPDVNVVAVMNLPSDVRERIEAERAVIEGELAE